MFFTSWIETYFHRMGNENLAGTAEFIMGIIYLISCLIMPYTCESAPRRLMFFLTFIGFGFCCMFMGPSSILGFYDSEWS